MQCHKTRQKVYQSRTEIIVHNQNKIHKKWKKKFTALIISITKYLEQKKSLLTIFKFKKSFVTRLSLIKRKTNELISSLVFFVVYNI